MQLLSFIVLTLTVAQTVVAGFSGVPASQAQLTESGPSWRVEVPRIGLNARVEDAQRTMLDGKRTWTVPCENAASRMVRGANTTLFGHRDVCEGVFDDLSLVVLGDVVTFDARTYIVTERRVVIPEDTSPIADYGDDRLTMISCWPPGKTTHRLVIVAVDERPGARPAPPKTPARAFASGGDASAAAAAGKIAPLPITIPSAGAIAAHLATP